MFRELSEEDFLYKSPAGDSPVARELGHPGVGSRTFQPEAHFSRVWPSRARVLSSLASLSEDRGIAG